MNENSLLILREVTNHLAGILDWTVEEAYLRIWPYPGWPENGDTELVLKMSNNKGASKVVKVGQAKDQDHIIVQAAEIQSSYQYSDLPARLVEWNKPYDPDVWQYMDGESFELNGSPELGWVIQDSLNGASIVCVLPHLQIYDIQLHFRSGRCIWIVFVADGASVRSDHSRKSWPNSEYVVLELGEAAFTSKQ